MYEWLNNLKVGDSVVIDAGYNGMSVSVVERITPTRIISKSGGKYRKKNGRAVGDTGWNPARLREPTDVLLLEIRKKFLCDKLRHIAWEKISVGVLADIYDKAKNGQHL